MDYTKQLEQAIDRLHEEGAIAPLLILSVATGNSRMPSGHSLMASKKTSLFGVAMTILGWGKTPSF
jgi:hypothetical protein